MPIGKMQETAEELFKARVYPFEAEDTFNNHVVEGYICKSQGMNYGSMFITRVDGKERKQVVRGTPKIVYPFDRARHWRFPRATRILAYDKLDGTNILLFRYLTADEWPVYSYKTRLMSFVRKQSLWRFHEKWCSLLERYPAIGKELWDANQCNISFEMYGSTHRHTMQYSTPLECAILFGRRDDGTLLSPADLDVCGVPTAELIAEIDADYVQNYLWQKQQMGETLEPQSEPCVYKGTEGQVWYCYTGRGVVQFKCKPETIESLHMSAGRGLSKHCVLTTCRNVFEDNDHITYALVETLLLEEFHKDIIKIHRNLIRECIKEVRSEVNFQAGVLKNYGKLRIKLLDDKRSVMRILSEFYPKSQMRNVYKIIAAEEGIL